MNFNQVQVMRQSEYQRKAFDALASENISYHFSSFLPVTAVREHIQTQEKDMEPISCLKSQCKKNMRKEYMGAAFIGKWSHP